jgi:signal transduction histidine kinase
MRALNHLRRAAARYRHLADLAVAAVIFTAAVLTSAGATPAAEHRPGAAGVLIAAAACGALAARKRWPLAVLAVTAVGAEAYLATYRGQTGLLILLAPLVALYTVADRTERHRGLTAGGLAVTALAVGHAVIKPAWMSPELLALAALGALAVAAGDASRSRRAYLAEAQRRAADAEREREHDARRRVTQERLRIARDLHDSLGHQLALIAVQAAVADQVLGSSPHQAHEALAHVTSASRSALAELSDTIGLLREPGDTATLAQPQPGLDSLSELIASFAAPGLHVALEVAGCQRPLTPAASITAYRVIQESLTNICKHAAIRSAQVRLAYEPAHLQITVRNGPGHLPASRGTASGRRGHGIAGMRERVTAAGGLLEAGTCPGGGFQVRATIPLTPATPPASTGAPRRPGPAVPPGAAPHAPSAVAAARA